MILRTRARRSAYPDATCALQHKSALELLVATILSAQSTDARVNMVTPALFAKYRGSGLCRHRPEGPGAGDPQHGVLPQQDQIHHRDGAGADRAPWRHGTRHHGAAGPAPRCGPQNRERRARHLVREERRHRGRHPRSAACDAARPDETAGPGEDRTGPDDTRAARQVDLVLAHADPPWASGVHRAAAEVRDLCNKPVVSEFAGMSALPVITGLAPGVSYHRNRRTDPEREPGVKGRRS